MYAFVYWTYYLPSIVECKLHKGKNSCFVQSASPIKFSTLKISSVYLLFHYHYLCLNSVAIPTCQDYHSILLLDFPPSPSSIEALLSYHYQFDSTVVDMYSYLSYIESFIEDTLFAFWIKPSTQNPSHLPQPPCLYSPTMPNCLYHLKSLPLSLGTYGFST